MLKICLLLAGLAKCMLPQTFLSHILNLRWTFTNKSRSKFGISIRPISSFGETTEQQLIFKYRTYVLSLPGKTYYVSHTYVYRNENVGTKNMKHENMTTAVTRQQPPTILTKMANLILQFATF